MQYIILSVSRSEPGKPVFWKGLLSGFTSNPFEAIKIDSRHINEHQARYNNGFDTLAIAADEKGLDAIGFTCTINPEKVEKLRVYRLNRTKKDSPDLLDNEEEDPAELFGPDDYFESPHYDF
ncbi:MAG: hypothetical protein ACTHMC_01600 [Pseudobacter sp.]|uniref:hypothetical protein n=1 Tax=Pseudobacter sp. TaxID=2045420 RepID=UPI003F7FAA01